MSEHGTPAQYCAQEHRIEQLADDRDAIIQKFNEFITKDVEARIALATKLTMIEEQMKQLLEFKKHINQVGLAMITALALAFVAWVASGGMQVPR
jgi:hypothetical protein